MSEAAQGTEQWYRDKAGKLSASRGNDVLGTAAARTRYRGDLLMEIAAGTVTTLPDFPQLRHGKETEDEARAAYELKMAVDVHVPGFIRHSHHSFIGASSDGVVTSTELGIEIKCPVSIDRHQAAIASMPKEHKAQVQWQMWVLGLSAVDFISYMPGHSIPLVIHRQYRDEDYINKLEVACLQLWEYVCTGTDPRQQQQLF